MAKQNLTFFINASAHQFNTVMNGVKGRVMEIGRGFGALAGIGGGLSVAGLSMFAKSAIDAADGVADLSKRSGLSIKAVQELSYVGKQAGVPFEAFANSIKIMQKNLGATETPKKFQAALESIGLTLADLKGLNPEEQFKKMTAAVAEFSDPTRKAALAQELFGKQGVALIPILEDGAAGMQAMIDKAHEMGAIMADENVLAADKFNDSMNSLNASVQALVVNSGFVGWLSDVAQGMEAMASNSKKMEKLGQKDNSSFAAKYAPMLFGPLGGLFTSDSTTTKTDAVSKQDVAAKTEENKKNKEEDAKRKQAIVDSEIRTKLEEEKKLADKKKKVSDEIFKIEKKSAEDEKKLREDIAKLQEDAARDQADETSDANITGWKEKIDALKGKLDVLKDDLGKFGVSDLSKGVLKTAGQVAQQRKDDVLARKIEAANSGETVAFSAEEKKRIAALEAQRAAGLGMEGEIKGAEGNISAEEKKRRAADIAARTADRNKGLASLQEKLGVTRNSAEQIANIKAANIDVVAALAQIKDLLAGRLPGTA
jgi:hypothetical protein